MTRDLHVKPFDEGTLAKLAIFRDYLRQWLPVFLASRNIRWHKINIFDFFAGPGQDTNHVKGSPLIIIDELYPYLAHIAQKSLSVNVWLNEYKRSNFCKLKNTIEATVKPDLPYHIEMLQKDFSLAFDDLYPEMSKADSANLIFMDQTGVRQITEDVFNRITNIPPTDFLFFVSSSTVRRFADLPAIQRHLGVDEQTMRMVDYYSIHRAIVAYYRGLLPESRKFFLAPFSIKKGSNIYGLIFGSSHVRGMEKFLNSCWKIDPERGEANYDIDHDKIIPGQADLFTGAVKKPKKVELFECELENKVMAHELRTNRDIYFYVITNGFTLKVGRNVIDRMIKVGKIEPVRYRLSYDLVKDDSLIRTFETRRHGQ